jgi:hypothetical protein
MPQKRHNPKVPLSLGSDVLFSEQLDDLIQELVRRHPQPGRIIHGSLVWQYTFWRSGGLLLVFQLMLSLFAGIYVLLQPSASMFGIGLGVVMVGIVAGLALLILWSRLMLIHTIRYGEVAVAEVITVEHWEKGSVRYRAVLQRHLVVGRWQIRTSCGLTHQRFEVDPPWGKRLHVGSHIQVLHTGRWGARAYPLRLIQ